ncbi:MAG: hypothetical protein WAT22_11870 [Saprospiraceae bacterium]|nr:hypothetical protein [Saprospiraceae bacterium]MBP6446733.1 hypothetical protein [Saprospiraceae bacterium]
MRSSKEDITLLDDYIKGNLDDQEIRDLETRLATETDLKSDLDELRILAEGMRVRTLASKLEMMRGWEEEIDALSQTPNNDKQSGSIFSIKRILLAASVVLVLIIGWWWMIKDEQNIQYAWKDEDFYKYILHQTERSNQIDLETDKSLAYNLFTAQNFIEAKPKLQLLWQNHKDTLAYFYLGISEFSVGNKEKAKKIFQSDELKSFPNDDLIKLCE